MTDGEFEAFLAKVNDELRSKQAELSRTYALGEMKRWWSERPPRPQYLQERKRMKETRTYGLIVVALICAIAAAITAFRGPTHFEDHGVFAALAAFVLTGKVLLDWRSRR